VQALQGFLCDKKSLASMVWEIHTLFIKHTTAGVVTVIALLGYIDHITLTGNDKKKSKSHSPRIYFLNIVLFYLSIYLSIYQVSS
jgi:hypothetical protein